MEQHIEISDVPLEKAESGMVLHEDAIGRAGQVLLPAGVTLTSRHIQLLSANGVDTLTVRSGTVPQVKPEKSLLTASEIDQNLSTRFRDNDPEHPAIKELTRICRVRMEAKQ